MLSLLSFFLFLGKGGEGKRRKTPPAHRGRRGFSASVGVKAPRVPRWGGTSLFVPEVCCFSKRALDKIRYQLPAAASRASLGRRKGELCGRLRCAVGGPRSLPGGRPVGSSCSRQVRAQGRFPLAAKAAEWDNLVILRIGGHHGRPWCSSTWPPLPGIHAPAPGGFTCARPRRAVRCTRPSSRLRT